MDAIKPRTLEAMGVPVAAHTESPDVSALVERAKAGDPEAFGDLMRLYERQIISMGVQMGLSPDDALDACQDAFVKVFRYIRGFRSGRSFFKWLYRIAIHAIYDHLRRRPPAGMISVEELTESQTGRLVDTGACPDVRAESSELAGKLVAGMDCLSRREKTVFVLRDLQEMSTEEIGRIMHVSQVTVRRHCSSARQKLREYLFPRNH